MSTLSTSRMYYPNPDEEFVLQGGSPYYYRETPGFLSNSMLTNTTKNLTQHAYNVERYGDDVHLRGSLRTLSRSLTRVKGDINKALLEDASNSRPTQVEQSMSHMAQNEALRESMNQAPPSQDLLSQTNWYTKPIHLTESVNIPMSTEDVVSSTYFPVTLGELKSLEMLNDVTPGKQENFRNKQRPKTATLTSFRESVANDQVTRNDIKRLDNTYYLTSEAPGMKKALISFTSPYSDELSKLRLEKLRIEEQQYLELKRQAELEKVRGPKPKWYSLKGPEFHREARKNNELLRNSDRWDELLTYRERLVTATDRLRTALAECA